MALIADFANYAEYLSKEDIDDLKAAGFTGAIPGLQVPEISIQQIARCLYEGMYIPACYAESSDIRTVWPTLEPLHDFIPYIYQAVEEGSGIQDMDDLVARLEFIDSLQLRYGRSGVYSSSYMWGIVMGAQEGPPDRSYWGANYIEDNSPVQDGFSLNIPLPPGFSRCDIRQFRGTTNISRRPDRIFSVDYNWVPWEIPDLRPTKPDQAVLDALNKAQEAINEARQAEEN